MFATAPVQVSVRECNPSPFSNPRILRFDSVKLILVFLD